MDPALSVVDVTDPNGEFLAPGAGAGVGNGTVAFSAPLPNDPTLCGFSLFTQGYGFGGPGIGLHNAYDLVIGQ